MKILSVETSSPICSVSILENTDIIFEKTIFNELSHSENLMPIIKEGFESSNLSLKDIDLFACSKGPGSFTGIRIGVSTIKAFEDVYSKQSYGISSLEGLAYNTKSDLVFSIIDAKNDNVYAGLFKKEKNYYKLINKYFSDNIENVINCISEYKNSNITFVGDGSKVHNEILKKNFINYDFSVNNNCNSVSIGIAAYNHYINNLNYDNSLSPMYLKKSQAERELEKKT